MSDSDSRVGEVLASKYRLQELLGSGAMGDVYRAVNEHVGRTVAIKVLRTEHAQNGQVVERFLREARAANLVRHPNVVDVLDIGKEEGGAPFIVQELLVGEDLARFVERRGGKLDEPEVCKLLLPVIEAVAEAHARGVIHRDIKPANVFLCASPAGPVPKLLDFGISKVRAPDLRATEVGMMMGTPAYMAPEQVTGARDADPRSDVWALGVMMFELLAGRIPFDAQDAPALFVAIATQDAPALAATRVGISTAVSNVVARCLRRVPDQRYQSAAEVASELRRVMGAGPPSRPQLDAATLQKVPDLDLPGPTSPRTPKSSPRPPDGTIAMARAPETRPNAPPAAAPQPAAPPSSRGGVRPSSSGQAAPVRSVQNHISAHIADATPNSGVPHAPAAARSGSAAASLWGQNGNAGTPQAFPIHPSSSREPHVSRHVPGSRADYSSVAGLLVVGLVAVLGTGIFMRALHRPDGWPVAQFLFAPSSSVALGLHGAFALLALVFALSRCRSGVLHWRGDLSGGRTASVLNGAFAAGAFFAAIELLSAVF